MARHGIVGILGLVFTATSLLLLFFLILSGISNITPFNKTYFLRADTSGITGSQDITQWTYFFFCGDGNQNCGPAHAAPAFGGAWDGMANNIPGDLGGGYGGNTTSEKYYYLWRFGWVFLIITLFWETLAFFSAFLACFGRLGSAIASTMSFLALFCHTVAAALITVEFVKARDQFRGAGRDASIGEYAFGFLWASWVAELISQLLFCIGLGGNKGDGVANSSGRTGMSWRRRRSQRSYDGRRVKDEYS